MVSEPAPLQNRSRTPTRYSLFVTRAKLVLPVVACIFVLLLTSWPYISRTLSQIKDGFIPLQIHDLRMVKPRYSGLDRDKHPFTITADVARENGGDAGQADALIALELPRADIVTKEGSWVVLSGKTGVYQAQAHFLDLFGDVTMFRDNGYKIVTPSARVDLNSGLAEGHEPVTGGGPSGTIESEGFKSLDRGNVIYFTGKAKLVTYAAQE